MSLLLLRARSAIVGAARSLSPCSLLLGAAKHQHHPPAPPLAAALRLLSPPRSALLLSSDSGSSSSELAASSSYAAGEAAAREDVSSPLALPALTAAWTLLPDLMPSLLLVGKKSHRGKNKRKPKRANHGALPCSHVMRRQRAAAMGRNKANHHR